MTISHEECRQNISGIYKRIEKVGDNMDRINEIIIRNQEILKQHAELLKNRALSTWLLPIFIGVIASVVPIILVLLIKN